MINAIILSMFYFQSPIYEQIINNRPNINQEYAQVLSKSIQEVSKKYNIEPNIYTAILMQESTYRLDAINTNCKDYEILEDQIVINDDDCKMHAFGIAQIHYKNLPRYGFNKIKLLTNLDYSLEAGARVLSDMKRMFPNEDNYWVRYYCGTARNVLSRRDCQNYERRVRRWL